MALLRWRVGETKEVINEMPIRLEMAVTKSVMAARVGARFVKVVPCVHAAPRRSSVCAAWACEMRLRSNSRDNVNEVMSFARDRSYCAPRHSQTWAGAWNELKVMIT